MKHLYFLSLIALMSMPSFAGNNLPQRRLPAVQKAEAGLPGLSSIISSQPEGTLYKDLNHYFEGCYASSDGYICLGHRGGQRGQHVYKESVRLPKYGR